MLKVSAPELCPPEGDLTPVNLLLHAVVCILSGALVDGTESVVFYGLCQEHAFYGCSLGHEVVHAPSGAASVVPNVGDMRGPPDFA